MNVTSKLKMDLLNSTVLSRISVMQEDTNTRFVQLHLCSGTEAWEIPAGTTAAVGFKKPDGTCGLYDRLPDGTDAIVMAENTVTVALAPQMLTVPGLVIVAVTLYDDQRNQLTTFPFHIQVEENPAVGEILSQNYCYYTSIADINEALQAALIQMEETVTSVETKMENGDFNGKSAYTYAQEGGYEGTEEAFSQMLANSMTDEAAVERIVAEYLEENPPVSDGIGENGATFTPNVDDSGNLSWSNDRGLANPPTVNIKGPKGETGAQGPQGEKGEDGTGVTILGSFETAEALRAEHPAGAVGDSYLVAGHLYVWSQSDSDWVDVGNIQGPQGEKGETGDPGKDGAQGAAGAPGQDGTSATHFWNGTVLTVTSASGTSSADLKGEKGDTGAAGEKGDKGDQGDPGVAGYSPVRGTDYWTAEDIAEMKSYVDNAILGGVW